MGCSHSVREEKPRQRKNKPEVKEEVFIPLESKSPTLKNKITLKTITQDTRESHKITPKTEQLTPKTVSTPSKQPVFNPYEMGGGICYGYGGIYFGVSSKKGG